MLGAPFNNRFGVMWEALGTCFGQMMITTSGDNNNNIHKKLYHIIQIILRHLRTNFNRELYECNQVNL